MSGWLTTSGRWFAIFGLLLVQALGAGLASIFAWPAATFLGLALWAKSARAELTD